MMYETMPLLLIFIPFIIVCALVVILYKGFYRRYLYSKEILQEIFEGSNSARLVTDIRDKAVFYNPAFQDLCEEGEQPSLKTIRNLLLRHTHDVAVTERLEALINNARRGHEDVLEIQTYNEMGEIRWYRLSAQPVAGWMGTVHWRIDNVTERLSVENIVREEREKLVDFTDHAPVGFYAMNESGRFTFVNATLARWLGNDIDSLLNNGFLHSYMVTPPQTNNPYDVLVKGGVRQVVETELKGPGGRVFQASINQSIVIEDEGKIRVRGVVHDLTTEREMRRALRESEDKFRVFFDEAPLGIAILDTDHVVVNSNQMLGTLSNQDLEAIEGQPFSNLVVEKNRGKVSYLLKEVREKKIVSDPIDVELLNPIGDDCAVKIYACCGQII